MFFRLPQQGYYNGSNSVYLTVNNNGNSGTTPDADEIRLNINLGGQPWGNRNLRPNINYDAANLGTASSYGDRRGQWVHVEILMELNTTGDVNTGRGDGVVKVWIDGVLTSDHRNVMFQVPGDNWYWQILTGFHLVYGGGPGAPSQDQYIWSDDIYYSGSN
jgi:hypothetical protein